MSARRTLILLTLNEIEGVKAVVPTLPAKVADEIFAIDGGSTDGTREWLAGQGIRVVVQKTRGRGAAFREAVQTASGSHFVFFSPDGNETVSDISRLFEAIEKGADLAIGSRFLPGGGNEEDAESFPLRKWVNRAFTGLANLFWNRGPRVTDTINGFRAITREAFERLALRSVGFTIEYEMTIHAMREGLRIVEIPTVEGPRVGGETKAPSFRTGVVFLKLLLEEMKRSLLGS